MLLARQMKKQQRKAQEKVDAMKAGVAKLSDVHSSRVRAPSALLHSFATTQ